jgi:putative DNA primase/helicase
LTEKPPKSYTPVQLSDVSNIPETLRNSVHWVCWGPRGEGEKTPVNPRTGANAKSNDRNTWGTLGEAIGRFLDRGEEEKLNGIGFMFSAEDPFVGIDLDACRDKETGVIAEHFKAII